jgi:hypothetical protein
MGFKLDSSFLKYLTMGASATQRVMQLMRDAGLEPIELERYASTNKIWATKVKRLRLPDLLCIRTGLRVEVRGKTKLEVRMSDAPNNVKRRWFAGLQNRDLIAFVKCDTSNDGLVTPAARAEFFWVGDLRRSFSLAKHGNRKSGSEGAEQDVCWPTTVAKSDGKVVSLSKLQLKVQLATGRKQCYRLGSKKAYVSIGEQFMGGAQFLAGPTRSKASLLDIGGASWDPRTELRTSIDRYVCAKALGRMGNRRDFRLLHELEADRDPRVALEASAALAKLGVREGLDQISLTIESPAVGYLQMEGVFILGEIRGALENDAVRLLEKIARNAVYADEVCQAAIWCLGHKGHSRFHRLLLFLGAPTENQRLHAITAFGSDVPKNVCKALVNVIADAKRSELTRSAAGEVLTRLQSPERALPYMLDAMNSEEAKPRLLSVLGSMDSVKVASAIKDKNILKAILPVQLASRSKNWTRTPESAESLSFLAKQIL